MTPVLAGEDSVLRVFSGTGAPPATIAWDGETDTDHALRGGDVYGYSAAVDYADGIHIQGPHRTFGVDRHTSIALTMTGDAFETGKATLHPSARKSLAEVGRQVRRSESELVIVEGHTDAVGETQANVSAM